MSVQGSCGKVSLGCGRILVLDAAQGVVLFSSCGFVQSVNHPANKIHEVFVTTRVDMHALIFGIIVVAIATVIRFTSPEPPFAPLFATVGLFGILLGLWGVVEIEIQEFDQSTRHYELSPCQFRNVVRAYVADFNRALSAQRGEIR